MNSRIGSRAQHRRPPLQTTQGWGNLRGNGARLGDAAVVSLRARPVDRPFFHRENRI